MGDREQPGQRPGKRALQYDDPPEASRRKERQDFQIIGDLNIEREQSSRSKRQRVDNAQIPDLNDSVQGNNSQGGAPSVNQQQLGAGRGNGSREQNSRGAPRSHSLNRQQQGTGRGNNRQIPNLNDSYRTATQGDRTQIPNLNESVHGTNSQFSERGEASVNRPGRGNNARVPDLNDSYRTARDDRMPIPNLNDSVNGSRPQNSRGPPRPRSINQQPQLATGAGRGNNRQIPDLNDPYQTAARDDRMSIPNLNSPMHEPRSQSTEGSARVPSLQSANRGAGLGNNPQIPNLNDSYHSTAGQDPNDSVHGSRSSAGSANQRQSSQNPNPIVPNARNSAGSSTSNFTRMGTRTDGVLPPSGSSVNQSYYSNASSRPTEHSSWGDSNTSSQPTQRSVNQNQIPQAARSQSGWSSVNQSLNQQNPGQHIQLSHSSRGTSNSSSQPSHHSVNQHGIPHPHPLPPEDEFEENIPEPQHPNIPHWMQDQGWENQPPHQHDDVGGWNGEPEWAPEPPHGIIPPGFGEPDEEPIFEPPPPINPFDLPPGDGEPDAEPVFEPPPLVNPWNMPPGDGEPDAEPVFEPPPLINPWNLPPGDGEPDAEPVFEPPPLINPWNMPPGAGEPDAEPVFEPPPLINPFNLPPGAGEPNAPHPPPQ